MRTTGGPGIEPPREFRIERGLPPGRHRLLSVFPGLDEVPPFSRYPGTAKLRRELAQSTVVELVRSPTWMYVAPHEPPPFAKDYGWNPVLSDTDCIVVGRRHLVKSPAMTLYLDVLHEFYHVFQRHAGRNLWDITNGYVGSPTELEAYRFAVAEARRLLVSDAFLRDYLKVEWVTSKDHARLVKTLGISPKPPPRPRV